MTKFSKILKFCREKINYSIADMARVLNITIEEYKQIEEAKALVPIEIYKELDRHFDFEQFGLRNDIIDDLQLYDLVRAEFQRGQEKQ